MKTTTSLLPLISLFSICLISLSSHCLGQYIDEVHRSSPSPNISQLFSDTYIQAKKTDSAIFTIGYTRDRSNLGSLLYDGWFCRLDTFGHLEQQYILRLGEKRLPCYGYGTKWTDAGEMVATVVRSDDSSGLIWVNTQGEIVKYHEFYPDNYLSTYFRVSDFHLFPDKSYYILYNEENPNYTGTVLIHADSLGNELERKKHYTTESHSLMSSRLLKNGNEWVIGGRIEIGTFGLGGWKSQVQVVGLDSLGNKQWEYRTSGSRWLNSGDFSIAKNGDLLFSGWEAYPRDLYQRFFRFQGMVARFDLDQQKLKWVSSTGRPWFSASWQLAEKENGTILTWGTGVWEVHWDSLLPIGRLFALSPEGDSLWEKAILHARSDTSMFLQEYYTGTVEILPDKRLFLTGYVDNNDFNSPDFGGWAWMVITDSNGCQSNECLQVETEPSIRTKSRLTCFPNPVENWMVIHLGKPLRESGMLRLRDVQGKLLEEKCLSPGSSEWTLDMVNYPYGFYLIELETNGKKWAKRVIKR